MPTPIAITIAVTFMLLGLVGAIWPATLAEFQEDESTSPEQAVRQTRIGSIILFLFAAGLLWAVLTAKGPADFIGV